MRTAINGLGRVGGALLRQAVLSKDLEVVAVNDLADPRTLAALLWRDTTYRPSDRRSWSAGRSRLTASGPRVRRCGR
jgi:glyceraldehyde-3-phosphate dehydrogenase/erythrose-4-phosphate dehydrogenase